MYVLYACSVCMVFLYIFMYVFMSLVYVYVCICDYETYVNLCMYVHVRMYVCIYLRQDLCKRTVCIYVCMYVQDLKFMYVRMYVCMSSVNYVVTLT